MNELKFLEEQGVSSSLINKIVKFREVYPVSDEVKNRIIKPAIPFYGKDILEMAIAGILQGQNLLLTGPKATGKNILAENLAYIFNRPSYNISFHFFASYILKKQKVYSLNSNIVPQRT